MHLTKPPWINHSGKCLSLLHLYMYLLGGVIYAIDIHPSGTKVVTCGQGNQGGSGLVVVWNVAPVLDEQLSIDGSCPKLLSRMLHSRKLLSSERRSVYIVSLFAECVNCVRWSRDGKYLACGGDDHLVSVWQCSGRLNSAGTIGSDTPVNVEQYRCVHRLNGHSMDVLHLEWSHDGRYLASCSIDSTVIVWNANKFPGLSE